SYLTSSATRRIRPSIRFPPYAVRLKSARSKRRYVMTFSKETSLRALLMSVLFILVIDHVTLPTPTAFASNNGQQVFFYCPTNPYGSSMMDYGIVRGNNQHGQYVEWQGLANWGTGYTYIFTEGWWWVGNIQISWWV